MYKYFKNTKRINSYHKNKFFLNSFYDFLKKSNFTSKNLKNSFKYNLLNFPSETIISKYKNPFHFKTFQYTNSLKFLKRVHIKLIIRNSIQTKSAILRIEDSSWNHRFLESKILESKIQVGIIDSNQVGIVDTNQPLNNLYKSNKIKFYHFLKKNKKQLFNSILNFNYFEKSKLIFFVFLFKKFNTIEFLVNIYDFLFKIIQFIPILKSNLTNNFKMYINYKMFFILNNQNNWNKIYLKPSFFNQETDNFFFLKQKNIKNQKKLLFFVKTKKIKFFKVNFILFKINYIQLFLNRNRKTICQYYKKKTNNSFKIKNNFSLLNNSFYKKNWKILKNLKQKKSFLKFQKIYYVVEMIFFLSKNIFYKKKKKFSFQIQKFLWKNFIFKSKSFISLLSIIFESKYYSLESKESKESKKGRRIADLSLELKKEGQIIDSNQGQIIDLAQVLNKENKLFCFNFNGLLKDQRSKIDSIKKKDIIKPEIEIILGTLKFALFFELNYNILSMNLFHFFIKKSNDTIKKNQTIYNHLRFLLKNNFIIYKNNLLIYFLNEKKIFFSLQDKKYFVSNNSSFFYILNKFIKIIQIKPKYSKNLAMYRYISKKHFKNFYIEKNKIKQYLNGVFKYIYFDIFGLNSKIEIKDSNLNPILFVSNVYNTKKKLKNIRIYYNSFLFTFNTNFNKSFYKQILKSLKDKSLGFIQEKRKGKFILKNQSQIKNPFKSIFFTYKNYIYHNKILFYNFKFFFFHFSFFFIYKKFILTKIQNQYKFFFLKKWDPLKGKMFLCLFERIWKNTKTFYLLYIYDKLFQFIFFNSQFHKILIIEKFNLFLISYKYIFLNGFISYFFIWSKKLLNFLDQLDKKQLNLSKNKTKFNYILNLKGFILFFVKKREKNIVKLNNLNQNFLYFKQYGKKEWILPIQFDSIRKSKIFDIEDFLAKRYQRFLISKIFEEKQYFQKIQNKNQPSLNSYLNNNRCLILMPSKKALKNYLQKLKIIIMKSNSKNQRKIIYKLNLKIINWCFYYRTVNYFKIFFYCDKILLKYLWKWCCSNHPNKSKKWIQKKYFFCLNNTSWVFAIVPESFDSEQSVQKICYLPFHSIQIQNQ